MAELLTVAEAEELPEGPVYFASLRGRSLLARGPRRARAGPETPEAVKRLFDGVPDPCFWLVVEYAWLGDWRRP